MRALLAIDQSTSATKAFLFDCDGQLLDQADYPHQQIYPVPGRVEHNAEEIWRNLISAAGDVLRRAPGHSCDLAGVNIANQRETVVAFDRRTGVPLTPAISWQCRRGTALCQAQRDLGRDPEVLRKCGLPVDAYFSASKLQWILQNLPEVSARIASGDALLGTIDTYLIYCLTRESVFATDHTNASRTLLYNIHTRAWDEELCAWWGVPLHALAQIRASDAQFGVTDLDGLLSRPVPVCGVMGDSQAALFSHGCLETGTAKLTFGTGSSILVNVGSTPPRASRNCLAALAWVRGSRAIYALEGMINSSASTLTWLRDQLGIISDVCESEGMSEEVADAGSVYLIPAFSGLGAPYWRDDVRAAIVGLTAHSDRRHLVRAALESIAYQLRDVLEVLRSETGLALGCLRADGGPTKNKLLMQFVADLLRVELRVAHGADRAACGVALMGALALGVTDAAENFTTQSEEVSYQPKMSAGEAQERHAGWRRAVQQILYSP